MLFSPSPSSPPIKGGESNDSKISKIFTIALLDIVKTRYTPCVKCVLRPPQRGEGRVRGDFTELIRFCAFAFIRFWFNRFVQGPVTSQIEGEDLEISNSFDPEESDSLKIP